MECLEELYCDDTAIQELPPSISRLKKLSTASFRGCKPQVLAGSLQDTKASSLDYLSGLSSLVQLDLSDCRMLDGGITCDLGALTSLVVLNLSNNKFVSIPAEAISCLPQLAELHMVCCERLETLPKLPSSLGTVCLDECRALKGSIDSFTKCQNLTQISFTKCDQLLQDEGESQMAVAMFQHLLKGLSVVDDNSFGICFPGNMIPDWFTYKNWGPSILVNLPQNWYNNKFVGFALCVVSEMRDTLKLKFYGHLGVKDGINVSHRLVTPDGRRASFGGRIGSMGIKQNVDSNITCLAYCSFDDYWQIYNYWVHSPNEWCQFEVSDMEPSEGRFVHKGFGVRLLYEDDFKQSEEAVMSQSHSSHSQFGKMGLFPAVFDGSSYVKQKRDSINSYFPRLPPEAEASQHS